MINGEEIRGGMLIGDRRVASMKIAQVDGRKATIVRFEERTRKGHKRLSKPVTYLHGRPVPGTRSLTTWAMPAGPVGRTPGGKLHGGWYGDRDDNGRQGRADRHARMIDSLTYA